MKKLFTLTALLLFMAIGAHAQVRKTWDFTKGVSVETIADLDADSKWNVTYNDDGSFKQANEATKLSGPFIANGNTIKELSGLSLGTAGLSKNNNVIIFPTKFRLNRNNEELIFPKLVNGQTITIVGRSANSTAENRGIKGSYDYMQLIEGPEDCLIRASLGEVTLKWKIVTDSPDSVDVKFAMITGGVDFTLFMIDEGDVFEPAKVAYLYDGTEDQVYNTLTANTNYKVTPINVTSETVSAEALQAYDVTVVSASVPAENAAVTSVKEAMPWTPVLNMNAALYETWGYGTTSSTIPFIVPKDKKNKLFADIEGITEGFEAYGWVIPLSDDPTSIITIPVLGEYFSEDPILSVNITETEEEEPLTTIHSHNIYHNGYLFIPYVPEYNADGLKLIDNAIAVLQESKREITPATAPAISIVYKDLKTNVTIKAPNLPKAKVYYTTDGTEPTTESTEYTDVFTLTEESTVKAVAIAEGYTLSEVAEKLVDIKSQPKTPVISWTEEGSQTTIKITGEGYDEDVKIWYNFADELTTDTLKSTLYVDSIPVIITMPQNVTAFAVAGGDVWSEVAQQRVLVQNPRVVIDVAAHFSAPQWTGDNNPDGLSVSNGKGMFSWGASAASMYVGEGTIGEDPVTGDEVTIYGPEDMREFEVVNEPTYKLETAEGEETQWADPEWVLKSRGTCMIWQNTGAQTTNFGSNDNYNPMYSTDVDPLFPVTKNDIQFYKFFANEPGNGSIETIKKYQAPLDIVVLANMAGGPLLAQVSSDGENWETIGEIEKTGYSRMWGKSTLSFNGTNEVYVRITEEATSAGPKVFDIYIANAGENSQKLLQELQEEYAAGVQDVQKTPVKAVAGVYTLNGVRVNDMQRGLNIVVGADGNVKKVLVK